MITLYECQEKTTDYQIFLTACIEKYVVQIVC